MAPNHQSGVRFPQPLLYSNMNELINELIAAGYLKTPRIIEAFRKIDRQNFVPAEIKDEAYWNNALPIGFGQTISQPLVVAFMLELLEPQPGDKILEIGSGSGWQMTLLAELVGREGKIIAIERIPELVEMARRNLEPYGYSQVFLVKGDGSKGYAAEAPYDKIIAAATAREVPIPWKEQLKSDGRIVFPRRNSILRLIKNKSGEWKEEEYPGFVFVPLIEND